MLSSSLTSKHAIQTLKFVSCMVSCLSGLCQKKKSARLRQRATTDVMKCPALKMLNVRPISAMLTQINVMLLSIAESSQWE